ncbi:SixA phosphatase family protein [Actinopolyspora saharensis]|uniref:Phosphohistidine phosphatase n=1 Tax=Actinopolyspora saharensis TaxID=995062 RepID=A0A1H1AC25_9ACTN|nr:histidine phosphatase family protein [Actinopolyspora saharensis]SDQ37288.1 phosphohistidine phosphatase [Actinopolyspora saharensis]
MNPEDRLLILLRHAKADRHSSAGDHERPLAERGRTEAPLAGSWLREHGYTVDRVMCSTAARARRTSELALSEIDDSPGVFFDRRMYGADVGGLLEVVHDLPEEARTAVLIAHNPGLQEMVGLLTGEETELRTSAIAVLRFRGTWKDADAGRATLEAVATPRAQSGA